MIRFSFQAKNSQTDEQYRVVSMLAREFNGWAKFLTDNKIISARDYERPLISTTFKEGPAATESYEYPDVDAKQLMVELEHGKAIKNRNRFSKKSRSLSAGKLREVVNILSDRYSHFFRFVAMYPLKNFSVKRAGKGKDTYLISNALSFVENADIAAIREDINANYETSISLTTSNPEFFKKIPVGYLVQSFLYPGTTPETAWGQIDPNFSGWGSTFCRVDIEDGKKRMTKTEVNLAIDLVFYFVKNFKLKPDSGSPNSAQSAKKIYREEKELYGKYSNGDVTVIAECEEDWNAFVFYWNRQFVFSYR